MTTPQLLEANLVLLAQNHNPTIASKDWLYTEGVMPEEAEDFVHVPILSQYNSANFNLILEQNRWQVSTRNQNAKALEQLPTIADTYVTRLPHTIYKATGFNFQWRLKGDSASDLHDICKKMFVNPEGSIGEFSKREDCVVTGMLKFDHEKFVVQVTFLPEKSTKSEISVSFNYEHVLKAYSQSDLETLKGVISQFNEMQSHSEQLISELTREW